MVRQWMYGQSPIVELNGQGPKLPALMCERWLPVKHRSWASHVEGALLDGGGPGGLGVAVGEVVGKGAPGGGEIGAGAGGTDGSGRGVVGLLVAAGVGGYNGEGSSGGTSGARIDERLGKGPLVGAIGIGGGSCLEVEGLSGAVLSKGTIEIESLGDIGEGDGNGINIRGYAGDSEGELGEDMVDGNVDVVTGLGGKDGEWLLTKADIGEGVYDHGLRGKIGSNHRCYIGES